MVEVVPAAIANRWRGLKHIKVVGYVPSTLAVGGDPYRLQHHGLFDKFDHRLVSEYFDHDPLWAVVQPTEENLMIASMKYDVDQDSTSLHRSSVGRAKHVCEVFYEPLWTAGVTSWDDVFSDIDYDTAAGLPFSMFGLQKKGYVMQFPDQFVQHCVNAVLSDSDVLFKSSPKIEFLRIEDIMKGKIRLFTPVGMHVNLWLKRLYNEQNRRVKQSRWVKLGTNMRNGGCHLLTRELEPATGEFVIVFDLPRCDKNHRLMQWIYQLRNKFLRPGNFLDALAMKWIERNISKQRIVMWDGSVIESCTTNPSGQNNTADDNCPWTLVVILTLAIEAYPECTDFDLKNLVLHVYSDDFRGKFGPNFARLRDQYWVMEKAKEIFHIEFKVGDWKVYDSVDGTHFLGADTRLVNGFYLPFYNAERLYAAWYYQENSLTEGQNLLRLRALLITAWPHKHLFKQFREFYVRLLASLSVSKDLETQAIVKLGVPDEASLRYAFTGLESYSRFGFCDFLPEHWRMVGVKIYSMNNARKGSVSQSDKQSQGNREGGKGKSLSAQVAAVRAASPRPAYEAAKASKGSKGSEQGGKGRHKVDDETTALGNRVIRVASAVKGGHKSRVRFGGGASAGGTPGGHQELVGNSWRHFGPVGSPALGRFVNVPLKQPVVTLRKNGKSVATIKKSYGGAPLSMKGGPRVATSSQYLGAELRERDHLDPKKGRMVQITGHQYLASVSGPPSGQWAEGDRMNLILLTPDALGGRLALLSQQFEQHNVKKLRVLYKPTVSSISTGAVAMYFRNDVGTPGLDVGVDELNHASTHPSFVQTQIWEPATMDISPSDALKRYFDEETGDFRTEVQGLLTVIAASDLPDLEGQPSYGNLYLEFDIDFYGEELDYEVQDIITGSIVFTGLIDDDETMVNHPVVASIKPPATVPVQGEFLGELDVSLPSTEFLLYGVITQVSSPGYFCTLEDPTPIAWTQGQSFYMRIVNTAPGSFDLSDGSIKILFFSNLSAASNNIDTEGVGDNAGQLLWTGSIPGLGTGPQFSFDFRAMPVSNQ